MTLPENQEPTVNDSQGRAVPPSGVVTFLFTDVEVSTRRWEADAEGMRAALAAHDEVLGKAIEAHGGWLFKHTGDGVCAAFASPRCAVDAAVAAQLKLELPVRMGIATGEAELREADYFGAVLNRAARVMAAGHGGQSFWPSRRRDCSVEWIWWIWGRDGYATCRPRSGCSRSEHRDYAQTSRHCGRWISLCPTITCWDVTGISALAELVSRRPLVTIVGPGGVGKTALAREVTRRRASVHCGGARIVELAAVTDAAAVPDAVVTALGLTSDGGAPLSRCSVRVSWILLCCWTIANMY